MRIFALLFALVALTFTPGEADAQRRAPVRRAGVRRAPVRAVRRAPVRFVRRAPIVIGNRRAAIVIGRAPIVVGRQAVVVRRQAIVVNNHNIAPIVVRRYAAQVVVPTYSAYVAPSAITVQRIVTAPYTAPVVAQEESPVDPCPIQQVVIQREVTGYSGGCGATAAFRYRGY